jgi:hypothetical protein
VESVCCGRNVSSPLPGKSQTVPEFALATTRSRAPSPPSRMVTLPSEGLGIVNLWVARQLWSQGIPAAQIQTIPRLASPHFLRRHGHPDDYLRRTVARAAFPALGRALCLAHTRTRGGALVKLLDHAAKLGRNMGFTCG